MRRRIRRGAPRIRRDPPPRGRPCPRPGVDRGAARLADAARAADAALPAAGLGSEATGQLIGEIAQVEPVAFPLEPRGIRLLRLGRDAVLDPQPLHRQVAVPRDGCGQHRLHAPGAGNARARAPRNGIARADIEAAAGPADIGLDRDLLQPRREWQADLRGVGHGEDAVRRRARHQCATARREGVGPRDAQAADPEAARDPLHRPGDAVGPGIPRLDQARHDHAVGPPQPAHRDPRPRLPGAGETRRRDPLAEDHQPPRRDRFHRPDHLAGHVDPPRGEPGALRPGHHVDHLPDLEVGRLRRRAVDAHLDVRRIGDAQVVDDDRAEAADRADHAGAADPAVALAEGPVAGLVGPHHAGAADALVARRLLRPDGGRQKGRGAREQAQDEPAVEQDAHRPASHRSSLGCAEGAASV